MNEARTKRKAIFKEEKNHAEPEFFTRKEKVRGDNPKENRVIYFKFRGKKMTALIHILLKIFIKNKSYK